MSYGVALLSNLIKWRQNLDHLDHSGFSFLVLAALVVMHLGLQCGITQIKVRKKGQPDLFLFTAMH